MSNPKLTMAVPSRRQLTLLAVLWLTVASGCLGHFDADETASGIDSQVTIEYTAEAILDRASAGEEYRTVRGSQTVTITRDDRIDHELTIQLWERSPDWSRMVAREPNRSRDALVVRHGTTVRHYDPRRNQIRIRNETVSWPFGSHILSAGLLEETTASVRGTDTVLGRSAYVIDLTPTTSARSRGWQATIWIDQARFYPLRFVTEYGSTNVTRTTTLEDISFAGPIDPDRFSLDRGTVSGIHTGEFDSVAAADLASPVSLSRPTVPAGYSLLQARVSGTDQTPIVRAIYQDGAGDRLSVRWSPARPAPPGEQIVTEGSEMTVVADPHWTAVYSPCGSRQIVVGSGALDRDALVAVAGSVDC